MEFNTQVCTTREQSERLLSMGLNPETADMVHYKSASMKEWGVLPCSFTEECSWYPKTYFPAWSLHRLWVINNDIYCELSLSDTFDCMIDEIEDKVRHGLLNKEYLMK